MSFFPEFHAFYDKKWNLKWQIDEDINFVSTGKYVTLLTVQKLKILSGNVVSTLNWIRPVYRGRGACIDEDLFIMGLLMGTFETTWKATIVTVFLKTHISNSKSCKECQDKGSFTPSDSVTNVTLMGKMGTQPILPVTVSIKKIKGAARQCYGDGDRVVQCEQTLTMLNYKSSQKFFSEYQQLSPLICCGPSSEGNIKNIFWQSYLADISLSTFLNW